MTIRRDERGGILAVSAILMPVLLLLAALVLDVGTWYAHKRSLQNRADAGALAAGFEYLSQLGNCTDPTRKEAAAEAIAQRAKQYAGANGTPDAYNVTPSTQARVKVAVNATRDDPELLDNQDGGDPCTPHGASNRIWTDVIAQERKLGSLAGAFGINLSSITARARVEVNQIVGAQRNVLPLVAERGDDIGCVWALFVDPSTSAPDDGFEVVPGNPIELEETAPNVWTGTVLHLILDDGTGDVAVEYWVGPKDGGTCEFDSATRRPLPHAVGDEATPVAIDWINVYGTGPAPGAGDPPVLRQFALEADSCGGPGFLYTADTSPAAQCRVGFTAVVDTGANEVTGELTVQPVGTGVDPVTVSYDTTGSGGETTVAGTLVVDPNEIASMSVEQDYTQTGMTYLAVGWRQTSGAIGGKACPSAPACEGTFPGETVPGAAANVQQAVYTADPLGSAPLVRTSLDLPTTSFPALSSTPEFAVTFSTATVDKQRLTILRPAAGTSTRAVWCGGSGGALDAFEKAFGKRVKNAFGDRVDGGCQVPLVVNTRGSCGEPDGGWPTEPSRAPADCVRLEGPDGDVSAAMAAGIAKRFDCGDPDRWNEEGPPPDDDLRWVYVPLTDLGRLATGATGDFVPVKRFARFYVVGWGWDGNAKCGLRPRGFDGSAAQLWGYFADIVTLGDDAIVGNQPCALGADPVTGLVTCKPELVR